MRSNFVVARNDFAIFWQIIIVYLYISMTHIY